MKEYEIVVKYCNGCSGSLHPQTSFEEAALEDPDDYIREKHGRYFDQFTKEVRPDGKILYSYQTGGVAYFYEFTEL